MAHGLVAKARNLWQGKWWFRVVSVWAAARTVSAALFGIASATTGASYWNPAHAGYFDYLMVWDAAWFKQIFELGLGTDPQGYSTTLPTNSGGQVLQNGWAFMPGFPLLVKVFSLATGAEYKYLAALVATLASFALALVVFRLFALKTDERTALWGLTLFAFSMASPVLQAGYAESLGLLFLALGLYFLMQHRYLAATPFLAALSITRPGMIAFTAMLAGMWFIRWLKNRRGEQEFRLKERWQLAGLTLLSGVLGFAWLLIAWAATGRFDAYTATELAWRYGYTDNNHLMPFTGWFGFLQYHLGLVWGTVIPILVAAAMVAVMFAKSMRKLGSELRLWVGSYFLYLFGVFLLQSSIFRILLPAFPVFLALGIWSRDWPAQRKANLVLASVALQVIWIWFTWVYYPPDFTPP
ncbi:MAG: hypothetical protein ACKORF_05645 [Micrococcales bacterium]